MNKEWKVKVIISLSILYALTTFVIAFISWAHISEGNTIELLLKDNDGRSSLFQLIISPAIFLTALIALTKNQIAFYALTAALILGFCNMALSIVLSPYFTLFDFLNPLFWVPLLLAIFSARIKQGNIITNKQFNSDGAKDAPPVN